MAHIFFLFNIADIEVYIKREGSILSKFRISKVEKCQAETSLRCGHRKVAELWWSYRSLEIKKVQVIMKLNCQIDYPQGYGYCLSDWQTLGGAVNCEMGFTVFDKCEGKRGRKGFTRYPSMSHGSLKLVGTQTSLHYFLISCRIQSFFSSQGL